MISLQDHLESEYNLTKSQISAFIQMGKSFTVKAGHFILSPGEVSNRVFIIESGVVREYKDLPEGEETMWILDEGKWLYNMPSYYTDAPADVYIQALTNAKGYYFHQKDLEELVAKSHDWALVQTQIYRQYLLRMLYNVELFRLKHADDRLAFFEKHQPGIQNRVLQKDIASYLNITATQLSRIRKKRGTSKRKV